MEGWANMNRASGHGLWRQGWARRGFAVLVVFVLLGPGARAAWQPRTDFEIPSEARYSCPSRDVALAILSATPGGHTACIGSVPSAGFRPPTIQLDGASLRGEVSSGAVASSCNVQLTHETPWLTVTLPLSKQQAWRRQAESAFPTWLATERSQFLQPKARSSGRNWPRR